jgi:hypothetical protein
MMKNYPTMCPPSKNSFSTFTYVDSSKALRLKRGKNYKMHYCKNKNLPLLPGHFSICKKQHSTPTSTKNKTSTYNVKRGSKICTPSILKQVILVFKIYPRK